jgi:hypothetical protein
MERLEIGAYGTNYQRRDASLAKRMYRYELKHVIIYAFFGDVMYFGLSEYTVFIYLHNALSTCHESQFCREIFHGGRDIVISVFRISDTRINLCIHRTLW